MSKNHHMLYHDGDTVVTIRDGRVVRGVVEGGQDCHSDDFIFVKFVDGTTGAVDVDELFPCLFDCDKSCVIVKTDKTYEVAGAKYRDLARGQLDAVTDCDIPRGFDSSDMLELFWQEIGDKGRMVDFIPYVIPSPILDEDDNALDDIFAFVHRDDVIEIEPGLDEVNVIRSWGGEVQLISHLTRDCDVRIKKAPKVISAREFVGDDAEDATEAHDSEKVVTSSTGGKKGTKLARYDLIPVEALNALATHYGIGESKYPTGDSGIPNFRLGYDVSLSYAAMQRHANQFWGGEDIDPETGSPHIIAAAWHALFIFQTLHDFGDDFDDRLPACRKRASEEAK